MKKRIVSIIVGICVICSFPVYSSAAGESDTTVQSGIQEENIDVVNVTDGEELSPEETETDGQDTIGEGSTDENAENREGNPEITTEEGTDTPGDGKGEATDTEEAEAITVEYQSIRSWINHKTQLSAPRNIAIAKWVSDNTAGVTVTVAGLATAKKVGKTVVKGYDKDGNLRKQITVTVNKRIRKTVKKVVWANHTYRLKSPDPAAPIKRCTTTNKEIVSVTKGGLAKAHKLGRATVRGYDIDGNLRMTATITVRLGRDYTLFVAYRGDSLHAPENTLPAFRNAVRKHYGGIEMDIWESRATAKSSPPCIIVMHDNNIRSKTGKKLKTNRLNWANHKKWKIKRHARGLKKYGRQTIPTLNEALNCVYKEANKIGKKNFVVELDVKNPLSDRAVKYIIKKVGRHPVHVLSANQTTLRKFKKYRKYKTTEVWYCTGDNKAKRRMAHIRSAGKSHFDGISIPGRNMNVKTIKLAKSYGMKVGMYGVKSAKKVQYWKSKGVCRFNMQPKVFR